MALRKGMILAAGLGTRLLPITKEIPKPLVPVLNIPNILHTIDLFERAGVNDIIINTFHLGDVLEAFFHRNPVSGVRISFSKEDVLMGTGGGVKLAEKFFCGESFVLSNCDFVTDIDLAPVIANHLKRKALATMVLIEDCKRLKEYSAVGTTTDGHLCKMPKYTSEKPAREGIFTGIHVLEAETLQYLEAKPCGINDILYPKLMQAHADRVYGEFVDKCYWYDTGDVPKFLESSSALLSKLHDGNKSLNALFRRQKVDPMLLEPLALLGEGVTLDSSATIGEGVVIGENCKIEAKATLKNCVILPGSVIATGKSIRDGIYFKGHLLPAKLPA